MKESWKDIVSDWFYRGLPLWVSFGLVLFSHIPLKSEFASSARPSIGLICVYFWLVYRSDLFNLASVFILGMVVGFVSLAPFGSDLFAFLVMYLLVTNLLKYLNGKIFIVIWGGFSVLLLAAFFTKWVVVSVYYGRLLPVDMVLFAYLTTVVLYPLISGINSFVLRHFLREDEL